MNVSRERKGTVNHRISLVVSEMGRDSQSVLQRPFHNVKENTKIQGRSRGILSHQGQGDLDSHSDKKKKMYVTQLSI